MESHSDVPTRSVAVAYCLFSVFVDAGYPFTEFPALPGCLVQPRAISRPEPPLSRRVLATAASRQHRGQIGLPRLAIQDRHATSLLFITELAPVVFPGSFE